MDQEKPNYSLITGTTTALQSHKTKNSSSFYNSIRFVIILGQLFSLMPVNGIKNADPTYIQFRWLSIKVFYSIFSLIGAAISIIFYVIHFINYGKRFLDIVNIIFFLSSLISGILFIRLASIWFDFNKKWLKLERTMQHYSFQPNISKRIQITTAIIMLSALGEHILSIITNVQLSNECPGAQNDPIRSYFGQYFDHVFTVVEYNIVIAIFIEIFHILATFTWNYSDLFVIIMCCCLAERFRQLNRNVEKIELKNEEFWRGIRENYTQLAMLCKTLDNAISHIVTLSLGNNLFFICIQLFNTLKPIKGLIQTLYFVYSFWYLLSRTIALSIYCCWINDESKIILTHLFAVPSEHFGIETSRLIQQISYCPVVITGSKYFTVTRGLCLQIAGAIITFEIILLQLGPMFLKTNEEFVTFCI